MKKFIHTYKYIFFKSSNTGILGLWKPYYHKTVLSISCFSCSYTRQCPSSHCSLKILCINVAMTKNQSLLYRDCAYSHLRQTHLAFFSTGKGQISLSLLITPGPPRQVVADDGVGVKARVEVHGDVLRIVPDVDSKAAVEVKVEVKNRRLIQHRTSS